MSNVIVKPMSTKYTVTAAAHIDAPPDRVYGIIADYRVGHPSILPKPFRNFAVEQGGTGAGTIIRFDVYAYGTVTTCRAIVTEPEPGRVLVEKNVEPTESVTTFTVVAGANGGTEVTFMTEAQSRDGIAGAIERFMSRRFLLKLYAEELGLLARLATPGNQPS
jgi:polyketide cyclase/dehydrase/lipid transport protein